MVRSLFLCKHTYAGIKVLEAASKFVREKPSVYLLPLWILLLSGIFYVFWVFSWTGLMFAYRNDSGTA